MDLCIRTLTVTLLTISIFSACGNERVDKNTKIKGQSFNSPNDTTASSYLGQTMQMPTLYVLTMNAGEFVRLANQRGDNGKRMVFQFCFSANYPNRLTLKGWAGKSNGRFVQNSSSSILTPLIPDQDNFGNEFFLGQQKLQKDSVKEILDRINNDTTKILIFNPEINATTKQITYSIDVMDRENFVQTLKIDKLAIIAKTNPSPPASSRDDQED